MRMQVQYTAINCNMKQKQLHAVRALTNFIVDRINQGRIEGMGIVY